MQDLPRLATKGVNVLDLEELRDCASDLGITGIMGMTPLEGNATLIIALWKRVQELEEAVRVLQEVSKTTDTTTEPAVSTDSCCDDHGDWCQRTIARTNEAACCDDCPDEDRGGTPGNLPCPRKDCAYVAHIQYEMDVHVARHATPATTAEPAAESKADEPWRDFTIHTDWGNEQDVYVACRLDDVCEEVIHNPDGELLTLGAAVDWAKEHAASPYHAETAAS